jgi:hypothetical protein
VSIKMDTQKRVAGYSNGDGIQLAGLEDMILG